MRGLRKIVFIYLGGGGVGRGSSVCNLEQNLAANTINRVVVFSRLCSLYVAISSC